VFVPVLEDAPRELLGLSPRGSTGRIGERLELWGINEDWGNALVHAGWRIISGIKGWGVADLGYAKSEGKLFAVRERNPASFMGELKKVIEAGGNPEELLKKVDATLRSAEKEFYFVQGVCDAHHYRIRQDGRVVFGLSNSVKFTTQTDDSHTRHFARILDREGLEKIRPGIIEEWKKLGDTQGTSDNPESTLIPREQ
jgi:hypothetical protein